MDAPKTPTRKTVPTSSIKHATLQISASTLEECTALTAAAIEGITQQYWVLNWHAKACKLHRGPVADAIEAFYDVLISYTAHP